LSTVNVRDIGILSDFCENIPVWSLWPAKAPDRLQQALEPLLCDEALVKSERDRFEERCKDILGLKERGSDLAERPE
jgi:hypothetical protein